MDYKKLIKALKCDGYGISQDMDGCGSRRCKYRDTDGACNIVSICLDASKAITDLLERAEVAEARCKAFEKMVREYRDEIVPRYMEMAENAEMERDAAVKELNEVAEAVDGLSDFIDEQVHPLVSYDIYTALRENADAISVWQYESEWRGQKED